MSRKGTVGILRMESTVEWVRSERRRRKDSGSDRLILCEGSGEHESLLHPEPQQMGHHCIGWCPVLGGKQRVSASVIDCGW